jgi:hypothetical protein
MKRMKWTLAAWLLVALAGAFAGQAAAQGDMWNNGYTFHDKPKMNMIPNSDVYYERKASGYDRYRYANNWYLVDDGTWYRSYSWQGPYVMIDVSEVPDEVTTIPGNYRRYWDMARVDEDRDRVYEHHRHDHDYDKHHDRDAYAPGEGMYAWPGAFSTKPSMHNITAEGVSYSHKAGNGNIDLYRYRSTWYLVDDGEWYRSDSWKGPFLSVSASSVPREVLKVPSRYRRHWAADTGY